MRVTYFILAPDSKRVKIGTTIKDPEEGRVESAFRACADGRDGYPYPFIEGYPSQKGLAYAFRHPTGD